MMAAADVVQQRREHWKKHYSHKYFLSSVIAASPEDEKVTAISNTSAYGHDYMRTRNMTVVGLLQGPFHHWFYTVLEKILPGRNAKSVLKKTFLDQSIASPTCLAIFFVGLGILESRKIEEICKELKLKFCETWKVRTRLYSFNISIIVKNELYNNKNSETAIENFLPKM